jgi:hypothetical protein
MRQVGTRIGVLDDVTGRTVIHSGTGGKGVFLSDTHELDLDTLTWHQVEVSGFSGSKGKAYAGAICWRGNIMTFGGTIHSPDEPPISELLELRAGWVLDMEGIPAELAMLIFANDTLKSGRPGKDRWGVSEVEAVEHGRKSLGQALYGALSRCECRAEIEEGDGDRDAACQVENDQGTRGIQVEDVEFGSRQDSQGQKRLVDR